MSSSRHVHLLVIDPQNDFCDLPAAWLPTNPMSDGHPIAPALPVSGAHQDMQRVAQLIRAGRDALSDITITLDSHHHVGIERPAFWQTASGSPVTPFTPITAADVRAGTFTPRDAAALPRVLAYLDALEAARRYTLMVWPTHCEIGTWGHNVHADVRAAYNAWEEHGHGIVDKVVKGSNPWTEHYSALQAEVPDPADPHTLLNRALIDRLAQADQVLIAGEAGSHCVRATTEHIADNVDPARLSSLVLLTDCMSPVGGFEAQHRAFLADMDRRGLTLSTSTDVLRELR